MRRVRGESILDVGCGTGLALSVMRDFFPHKTCRGIEPSSDGRPYWNERGINVDVGTAANLPYQKNEFDTVYSSHVIEHVEQDNKAIQEICRVAGKRSIIVVPDGYVDVDSHVNVYDRVSFCEIIHSNIQDRHETKIFPIPHSHIDNLVAVIDTQ
ncbi:class I SAM-dependent methyltransferase [Salinibacter ruber]|uniref:class I SAM-dependent methyltransferase n=1 Tax=Salinibacter ruber TaxID=146919 RepID=UPI003C6DFB7F